MKKDFVIITFMWKWGNWYSICSYKAQSRRLFQMETCLRWARINKGKQAVKADSFSAFWTTQMTSLSFLHGIQKKTQPGS